MKDGSLLTSAAKPSSEQWITHNPARGMAEISRTRDSSTVFQRTCREPAPPDNVKLVASWQTGLETPSALRQWKLLLQLVPSVMGAARSLNRDPRNDRHFDHRNFGTGPTESSAAKTKPKV
jgi:hypothetical protein